MIDRMAKYRLSKDIEGDIWATIGAAGPPEQQVSISVRHLIEAMHEIDQSRAEIYTLNREKAVLAEENDQLQAAERRAAALEAEVERLRREATIARGALRDYYPDRADPAALIDRIERAWHALEVALVMPADAGAVEAGS